MTFYKKNILTNNILCGDDIWHKETKKDNNWVEVTEEEYNSFELNKIKEYIKTIKINKIYTQSKTNCIFTSKENNLFRVLGVDNLINFCNEWVDFDLVPSIQMSTKNLPNIKKNILLLRDKLKAKQLKIIAEIDNLFIYNYQYFPDKNKQIDYIATTEAVKSFTFDSSLFCFENAYVIEDL